MSDGQTFYAVILLLYICSCIKSLTANSVGVSKCPIRGWRLHPPITTLAGVQKSLFVASLVPWPSALIASQPASGTNVSLPGSIASSLRLIRLAQRASNELRLLSLGIFILFFGLIPYSYYTEAASNKTLTLIGFSFFLIILATLHYMGLHRRFAPEDKAERYKQLFLALTMPWHAMRLSDEFLLNLKFTTIHPLALVSITNDSRGTQYLAQALRDSIYRKKPTFSEKEVRTVFTALHINTEIFLSEPIPDESPENSSYCPCCHSNYTAEIDTCSDCDDTRLIKYQ